MLDLLKLNKVETSIEWDILMEAWNNWVKESFLEKKENNIEHIGIRALFSLAFAEHEGLLNELNENKTINQYTTLSFWTIAKILCSEKLSIASVLKELWEDKKFIANVNTKVKKYVDDILKIDDSIKEFIKNNWCEKTFLEYFYRNNHNKTKALYLIYNNLDSLKSFPKLNKDWKTIYLAAESFKRTLFDVFWVKWIENLLILLWIEQSKILKINTEASRYKSSRMELQ